jgi:hypothetical protein
MKEYHVLMYMTLTFQVILFVLWRRATIFCIFIVEHDSVVYNNKFVVTLNVKVRNKFIYINFIMIISQTLRLA